MKRLFFNCAGDPHGDIPTITTDEPRTFPGVFESANRCIFTLPDDANGGGHLSWQDQTVNFLLPPPGDWEAADLGLPPLVYGPAQGELKTLSVSGSSFFTATGDPWLWTGISDFRLIERTLRGEDIGPLLRQRQDAGFNLVRVLAMKSNNTGWSLNPRGDAYWTAVLETFGALADVGLRAEWTIFADTRSVMPDDGEQRAFWARTMELARSVPLVMAELVNEAGHSTQQINPAHFDPPAGVLASHGSGLTDVHPVEPFWHFATYHARRETDGGRAFTNYDPYEFESNYPKACPVIPDEGAKPENYGYSEDYARRIGQHAACGAGGTFHWSGGVNSDGLSPEEFRCAQAFCQGLQG